MSMMAILPSNIINHGSDAKAEEEYSELKSPVNNNTFDHFIDFSFIDTKLNTYRILNHDLQFTTFT